MTRGNWAAAVFVACLYGLLVSQIVKLVGYEATEIRLIGECDGKFYGAMEEDQFPAGCAWIEPIRFDVD